MGGQVQLRGGLRGATFADLLADGAGQCGFSRPLPVAHAVVPVPIDHGRPQASAADGRDSSPNSFGTNDPLRLHRDMTSRHETGGS
jgi:hypothetical protein